MPSFSSRYVHQARKKRVFLISGIAVLLVLAAALVFFLRSDRNLHQQLDIDWPGSSRQAGEIYTADPELTRQMMDRSRELLLRPDTFLAEWYQLAGRTGQPPARQAESLRLSDQLYLGQYLLEQADQREFSRWWLQFLQAFILEEGKPALLDRTQSERPVRDNLHLLRILAQSCSEWPDTDRYNVLVSLSEQLLQAFSVQLPADAEVILPTPPPVLDPAATPTPWPEVEPTPDPESMRRLSAVKLDGFDLFTMQQLAAIDERWLTLYEGAAAIVLAGYLTDDLPLFALAFDPDTGGYIPFSGDIPVVSLESSLWSLLHLAEVGMAPERSLAWLKDQLYNRGALYTDYHIAQGSPADSRESLVSYALTARIARIVQDQVLYEQAIDRLLWHQATSPTSEARWAIFRQHEDLIWVWAEDNLLALLALD